MTYIIIFEKTFVFNRYRKMVFPMGQLLMLLITSLSFQEVSGFLWIAGLIESAAVSTAAVAASRFAM